MTPVHLGELTLAWGGIAAAMTAMLSRRASRAAWAAAALLLSAWLGLSQPPMLGAALAVGAVAGLAFEGNPPLSEPDFARVTRRLGLLAAALVAAVILLARFGQVEASQAPYAFPVLAAGMVALVAVFASAEPAEVDRAARTLLVVAAVGWTVATAGSQPAVVIAVAIALPVVAIAGRSGAGRAVPS